MVERQEVLRLSFLPGKAQPVQMIRATSAAMMRFRELSPSQRKPEALEELMQEIFSEPFDLVQGPLYRVEMLQRAPDDLVLVFAIHHAIADGWTLGVFVQDLVAAYLLGAERCAWRASASAALLHSLGCSRARFLAARGTGAARHLLEIPPGWNAPALEPARGGGGCVATLGFAGPRRSGPWRARPRAAHEHHALQHAADCVSSHAVRVDGRGGYCRRHARGESNQAGSARDDGLLLRRCAIARPRGS